MQEIQLTLGKKTTVSDSDFEFLSQWEWRAAKSAGGNYYAIRRRDPKKTKMHRLILRAPSGLDVDHINHNTLDNRRENLRLVTASQNAMNMSLGTRNKTGYRGVSWYEKRNKWRATIRLMGKQHHLGYFTDKKEAAKAYAEKAAIIFGSFAYKEASAPNNH